MSPGWSERGRKGRPVIPSFDSGQVLSEAKGDNVERPGD